MRDKIVIALLLAALPVSAANHYIRSGAGGANTGVDWTDAFTSFPSASSWVRGDTYYVADGSYGNLALSTATSGTTTITIKKASIADHGTSTGWSDTYGDGSADIGTISYNSQWWIVDGAYRTTWTNGYGFNLTGPSPGGAGIWFEESCSNNVLRYVNAVGHGATAPGDGGAGGDNAIWFNTSSGHVMSYLTIEKCRFYSWGSCIVKALGGSAQFITFNNNWCDWNRSSIAHHAEGVFLWAQYNNKWINNIWVDIEGTGVIMLGDGGTNTIYGNLAYWTSSYPHTGQDGNYVGNGTFTTWTEYQTFNNNFLFNTVVVPNSGGIEFGIKYPNNSCTGNVSNNMFTCLSGTRNVYGTSTTRGMNVYWNLTHDSDPTAQTLSSNPYVSSSAYNFRLSGHTTAGATFGAPYNASPYNVDADGTTRTSPDRGWNEYASGGDTTPPTISITTPTSSPTYTQYTGAITVAGSASDDTAVTSITATMAGATTGSISISGTTTWSGSTTLNPGVTVITAVAYDAAGNNTPAGITVTFVSNVMNIKNARFGP